MLQSIELADVKSDYLYDSGWLSLDKPSGVTSYLLSSFSPSWSKTEPNVVFADYLAGHTDIQSSYARVTINDKTSSGSNYSYSNNSWLSNYNEHNMIHSNYPYEQEVSSSTNMRASKLYRASFPGTGRYMAPNGERGGIVAPQSIQSSPPSIDFYIISNAAGGFYFGRVRVLTLTKAEELYGRV